MDDLGVPLILETPKWDVQNGDFFLNTSERKPFIWRAICKGEKTLVGPHIVGSKPIRLRSLLPMVRDFRYPNRPETLAFVRTSKQNFWSIQTNFRLGQSMFLLLTLIS